MSAWFLFCFKSGKTVNHADIKHVLYRVGRFSFFANFCHIVSEAEYAEAQQFPVAYIFIAHQKNSIKTLVTN